jgi:hypothetical protein
VNGAAEEVALGRSDTLFRLQDWYARQCNGVWEHSWGIKIDNIDNPGWMVTIDLNETKYEKLTIPELKIGDGDADEVWIRCWCEAAKFKGVGGASKLIEILDYFLAQMEHHDALAAKSEALRK